MRKFAVGYQLIAKRIIFVVRDDFAVGGQVFGYISIPVIGGEVNICAFCGRL